MKEDDEKVAAFMEEYAGTHSKMGYRRGRMGFGQKPALLVIDLQRFFTDKDSPMGGKPLIQKAVENTAVLLKSARKKGIQIIYTVDGYRSDQKDLGWWGKKVQDLHLCISGSKWAEMPEEIKEKPEDIVLEKKNASGFFGTPLLTILNSHGIDTNIITGCATSGCVRATVIDSFSYGYKTILVRDCCGDQSRLPHEANLIDMDNRYADVVSLEETLKFLEKR